MSGHYDGYLDAFFESVSAFTTTGMSLCVDVDHMALSLSIWRCVMHLIGGIGVVVIALALGVFGTGSAAASLYHAEARMGQVMPSIKQTSQFILKLAAIIVVVGTLVCLVPLLAVGVEPLRAAINGFLVTAAAFSTGGMTSASSGIVAFHCWPIEVIVLILAALGCINFVLYGDIWKGVFRNFFKDIEIRTIFVWVTLLAALMAFALAGSYFTTTGAVLRRGLFEVLSGSFNLGFSTLQGGQILFAMGSGALFVTILSMTICGSSSSASGGIKALRIGIIARSVVQAVRKALAPDRALPRTFFFQKGRHRLTPELVSAAMIIFLLYMVTYAAGAIAGIAYGYEALPAIFDSVSAASNTGLSLGVAAPGMPNGLEIIYIFEMWLGRLEFIAILAMVVEDVCLHASAQALEVGEKEEVIRRPTSIFFMTFIVVLSCLAMPALAVPQDGSGVNGGTVEIGSLSDRFESLDKLGNSLTDEESVVIETRVGVLVSANRALNDSEVSFTGEAVGDIVNADEGHKWVNIRGPSNSAISVYMPDDLAKLIQNVGDYHMTGTTLKITGTYHIACPEHEGELDVHASTAEVTDNGGPVTHMVAPGRLEAAFVLCIVAGLLLMAFLLVRRYLQRRDDHDSL